MICSFGLATGPVCHELPKGPGEYCDRHEAVSGCVGCGQRASRECPHFVDALRCGASLCPLCEHQELGGHAPAVSPAERMRQGLMMMTELLLEDGARRGLVTYTKVNAAELSKLIVDGLASHVLLQAFSGMANPQHD